MYVWLCWVRIKLKKSQYLSQLWHRWEKCFEGNLNERCDKKSLIEKKEIYKESSIKSVIGFIRRYEKREFSIEGRTKHLAKLFYNDILSLKE